jgi:hypothetical protein
MNTAFTRLKIAVHDQYPWIDPESEQSSGWRDYPPVTRVISRWISF